MRSSEHPVARLLEHVLAGPCLDPDCEVHRVEVGLAEGTVSPANYAFWLAGLSYLPEGDSIREMEFEAAREFLTRYSPAQ